MILRELLKDIDIREMNADPEQEIEGVCYDSRKAGPGQLFVAVTGFESDGHLYIASAVEKGACCVLCERPPECDVPYVLIGDTRRGLAIVGRNLFRVPSSRLKVIGVTGTNGKTTTTNLIKWIIEHTTGAKVGLIGTNNILIGDRELPSERTTPESFDVQRLLGDMADAGCEYAVMEVSSHALYLERVCGIEFELGIFTNLTQDHLDFHKTMEDYGRAKAILFTMCRKGIINLDDEYARMMMDAATCPLYTYSAEKDEADMTARNIVVKEDGVSFCALIIGILEKVALGIPGMFSVYNALAALSAAVNLGIPLRDAAQALSTASGVMGRAEVVPTGRDFTVIIDYAHTPDALTNILKTVKGFARGRVVTVFGCGGDRDKTKRPIMGEIGVSLSDFAVITSDNPRTEEPSAIISDILAGVKEPKDRYVVIENRKEAIGWAINNARPGDVIVLAGKGHETYQIIGKVKNHFDEREVVAEFLKQ